MRRATSGGAEWRGAVKALAVLALLGCSRAPSEVASKKLQSLHSWAASARMVGERRMQGAIPETFATKALQSFGAKLENARKQTAASDLPSGIKRDLMLRYDSVASATDSLLSALEHGGRREANGALTRLSAQASAADSARERLGAQ